MKNIADIKEQLESLAEVTNKFDSEAVQLKIVEFVLSTEVGNGKKTASSNSKRKPRKSTVKPKGDSSTNKSSKKSVGLTPTAILNKLVEEGFFKDPKTIGDIVMHCEQNMARKFKSSDFSGKLIQLVRNETLVREKNSDNQYEYQNK